MKAMRRAMNMALAGWFAVTMTLAQSCAAPAQSSAPYGKGGSSMSSLGASSSSVGSLSAAAETSTHLDTTGYTADQSRSEALTAYLKHHRLPLVGAQVLKSSAGQRAVVLYGFVGSDFGKHDAVTKTQSYLADSDVPVDNRIKVRPELLTAGASGGMSAGSSADETGSGSGASSADEAATGAPGDSQYPGVSSYEQQQSSQAQQYAQQQNAGSAISAVAPLLMLGLMALSMTSGGSFAVAPGGSFGPSPFGSPGGSAFGAAPYNPYPGFSSPSPYGSAVTPYGGAGSPYTSAPPSTSPYGP